jgi:hypothetical protein
VRSQIRTKVAVVTAAATEVNSSPVAFIQEPLGPLTCVYHMRLALERQSGVYHDTERRV